MIVVRNTPYRVESADIFGRFGYLARGSNATQAIVSRLAVSWLVCRCRLIRVVIAKWVNQEVFSFSGIIFLTLFVGFLSLVEKRGVW